MINQIYIENEIKDHPRVQSILKKFKRNTPVYIDKYASVFNKKNQNFRIQKKYPSLILSQKKAGYVLKTPADFGIGNSNNFYFSHMYNCLYDCDYCFLQGLYSSANYVLFVNYEDFFEHISHTIEKNKNDSQMFFSGYDCDSLAFDKISGFSDQLIQFFEKYQNVEVELRTKSVVTKSLIKRPAIKNCIIAFSLSPNKIAEKLDNKAPSIRRRIKAMKDLADCGWLIGLRFDPLIYTNDWKVQYSELICEIMGQIHVSSIHSVSYGLLRFPKKMYKKISNLHNTTGLFAFPLDINNNGVTSYGKEIESEMYHFIQKELQRYLPIKKIFHCTG